MTTDELGIARRRAAGRWPFDPAGVRMYYGWIVVVAGTIGLGFLLLRGIDAGAGTYRVALWVSLVLPSAGLVLAATGLRRN